MNLKLLNMYQILFSWQIAANQDKLHEEYMKKYNALHAKKEKLFEEGKIQNWELSPGDAKQYNFDQLKANKELAMKLLLAKVSKQNNIRKHRNYKDRS